MEELIRSTPTAIDRAIPSAPPLRYSRSSAEELA
jgi:hypothetical protein